MKDMSEMAEKRGSRRPGTTGESRSPISEVKTDRYGFWPTSSKVLLRAEDPASSGVPLGYGSRPQVEQRQAKAQQLPKDDALRCMRGEISLSLHATFSEEIRRPQDSIPPLPFGHKRGETTHRWTTTSAVSRASPAFACISTMYRSAKLWRGFLKQNRSAVLIRIHESCGGP